MDLLRKVNPGFYGFLATAWTECSAFPKAGSARDEPIFRSLNELIQRSTSSRFRGNLQLWQEFWLGGPWQFALQPAEKTWPFRTSHVHKKGAVWSLSRTPYPCSSLPRFMGIPILVRNSILCCLLSGDATNWILSLALLSHSIESRISYCTSHASTTPAINQAFQEAGCCYL